MRMDRVNISIPDGLLRRAKEAGLNISKLARNAIEEELERLEKIAALDRYLAELEAQVGPISPEEEAQAQALMERIYGPRKARQSA